MFALEIAKKVGTKRYETWKLAAEAANKRAARDKKPVLIKPAQK